MGNRPDIHFFFEGKEYVAPYDVYEETPAKIVLPDAQIVTIPAWMETFPPRPLEVKLVDISFNMSGVSQVTAVHATGGIWATEVQKKE